MLGSFEPQSLLKSQESWPCILGVGMRVLWPLVGREKIPIVVKNIFALDVACLACAEPDELMFKS
jgi:hypothetical protein